MEQVSCNRNLAIVFLLTGIWHGASWTFILWGVWHGTFILIERVAKKHNLIPQNKIYGILGNIYTLFVVGLGWVLFRAPSIGEAIHYIKTMFGFALGDMPGFTVLYYLNKWNIFNIVIGVLLATSMPRKLVDRLKSVCNEKVYFMGRKILLLFIFYFSLIRVVAGTYNPFIYFQF